MADLDESRRFNSTSFLDRLRGVGTEPAFRWATGVAAFAVLMAFGLRGIEFDLESVTAITQREADNIDQFLLYFVFAVVILWLLNLWRVLSRRAIRSSWAPLDGRQPVAEQLLDECSAMAAFALERGMSVIRADVATVRDAELALMKASDAYWRGDGDNSYKGVDDRTLSALTATHQRLAKLVEPAMPRTLRLLGFADSPDVFPWLGRVRLVRMLFGLVVVLIPLFVALAISVGVRLDNTSGLFGGTIVDKMETALYLVVAAALGAAFAALTKAFKYIGNLSYDDKFESSYWVRFILGVVAGLILATILAQALFSGGDAAADQTFRITVPLLALVGGFSSDLVYRILMRLIEAIETLVQGSTAERVELAKEQSDARLKELETKNRLEGATRLLAIREMIPDEASAAREHLDKILADLVGTDLASLFGDDSGMES